MDENYYITNLDLMLISEYYRLPIILLSGSKKSDNKDMLILNKNSEKKYYFILTSKIKIDQPEDYKLFVSKNLSINLNELTFPAQTNILIDKEFNLANYFIDKSKIKIKLNKPSAAKIAETEKLKSKRQLSK